MPPGLVALPRAARLAKQQVWGHFAASVQRSLFIETEDPPWIVEARIRGLARGLGIEELPGFYYACVGPFDLVEAREELTKLLRTYAPDFAVLSTLQSLLGGRDWLRQDSMSDVNALVVQAEGDVRKRKADQAIEAENLQQNVRRAKAALDKARLDLGAQDIRMPIDKELLKLSVEESEATYKELLQEVQIKKVAHAAEIRILELTKERQQRHHDALPGDAGECQDL